LCTRNSRALRARKSCPLGTYNEEVNGKREAILYLKYVYGGGGGGGEHIGARTAKAGEEAGRKSVCAAAPGGVYPYHIVNYITYSTKILISFERKYKDMR
jgi:hypothetical protein